MQIQINTDRNISATPEVTALVEDALTDGLKRFAPQITRVEVFLTDENSHNKNGQKDKRCVLEARMQGRPPVAVTQQSDRLEFAVDGAVEKMQRKLDTIIGRLRDRTPAVPVTPEAEAEEEAEV